MYLSQRVSSARWRKDKYLPIEADYFISSLDRIFDELCELVQIAPFSLNRIDIIFNHVKHVVLEHKPVVVEVGVGFVPTNIGDGLLWAPFENAIRFGPTSRNVHEHLVGFYFIVQFLSNHII